MRVVLDNNVLIHVMGNTETGPLHHPETGEEVTRPADRARELIDRANESKGRLLIPALVLTEYLLGIPREDCAAHIAALSATTAIEILPFDDAAAIECAYLVEGSELAQMEPDQTKAKLRADRQVLATALSAGVDQLWTHDRKLYRKAKEIGVQVGCLADIDPKPQQTTMPYE